MIHKSNLKIIISFKGRAQVAQTNLNQDIEKITNNKNTVIKITIILKIKTNTKTINMAAGTIEGLIIKNRIIIAKINLISKICITNKINKIALKTIKILIKRLNIKVISKVIKINQDMIINIKISSLEIKSHTCNNTIKMEKSSAKITIKKT